MILQKIKKKREIGKKLNNKKKIKLYNIINIGNIYSFLSKFRIKYIN